MTFTIAIYILAAVAFIVATIHFAYEVRRTSAKAMEDMYRLGVKHGRESYELGLWRSEVRLRVGDPLRLVVGKRKNGGRDVT